MNSRYDHMRAWAVAPAYTREMHLTALGLLQGPLDGFAPYIGWDIAFATQPPRRFQVLWVRYRILALAAEDPCLVISDSDPANLAARQYLPLRSDFLAAILLPPGTPK